MFTDWGGRKVSEYWGNVFRCGKSGFTVNRGAVNRGFAVILSSSYSHGIFSVPMKLLYCKCSEIVRTYESVKITSVCVTSLCVTSLCPQTLLSVKYNET